MIKHLILDTNVLVQHPKVIAVIIRIVSATTSDNADPTLNGAHTRCGNLT